MRNLLSWSSLIGLLFVAAACALPRGAAENQPTQQPAPPPDAQRTYRVFLIGDTGAASPQEPALLVLKTHLERTGQDGAVVFLGDNIYPDGLPDPTHPMRQEAEDRLRAALYAVEDFKGRVVFLPGNHDWNGQDADGRAALARQEAFVESFLDRGNTFLPDGGFPGPTAVELADDITLVALDTQWWFADAPPTGDTGEYDLQNPTDFLIEFEQVLYKHRDDNVLVVGHHPLFSNGNHGGHFSWKEHLSPFPLYGSVKPLYRRFIGMDQDFAQGRYRHFRREMLRLFRNREDLIYAAGHDHNLQYFRKEDRRRVQHFLVSGSGSKSSFVASGHGATFTDRSRGFLSLQYYTDNSIWLEAWTPSDAAAEGRLLFRQRLKAPQPTYKPQIDSVAAAQPDYRDSTVVQPVNPDYAKVRGLSALLLGRQHRELWATPVEVPVLDVAHLAGGLTPLKVGGQSQSITMRLQGADGKVYMLRSIDKVAGRSLSPELRRTVAGSVVQNQVSMQHPFGAFIIPPLSRAAGVFHTNPRLVYVPDDPRLGPERAPLVRQVVLFEERPDEDMSDVASMGYASNVIGSTKLLREINDDNDHRVDAHAFARARLLDMLVADHDRTTDNFRWAAFEPYELDPALTGEARKQGKVYLPIPRDRDMAFLQLDGLLPRLYSLIAQPAWQDFDTSYGYLRGLNQKGLPLDRRFTASLTRADWQAIADSMVAALTDAVIEEAVRTWPEPVFERAGAETIRTLKARRDQLPGVAQRYYELLATVVDVVGSHKHERFVVTRLPAGQTKVVVYKITKQGELRKELYRRTFYPGETREIRLYGQDGEDQFHFYGQTDEGIRVIAVGGTGHDIFADSSSVKGWRRLTHFYDTPDGAQTTTSSETRLTLKTDPRVNRYDPDGFKPDAIRPLAFFGSNSTDGLFIGGGIKITRHGFRKEPHASTHRVMGNYAARTSAFNLRYLGSYVDVVGHWSLGLEVGVYSPNNTRNFYGLGNETEDTVEDASFFEARFSRVRVKPLFERAIEPGIHIQVGPTFEYTDVRADADRFIGQPQAGISLNTFDRLLFGGAEATFDAETVDNPANPKQGFRFRTTVDFNAGLRSSDDTFTNLASALTLYLSPSLFPQVTIAARTGAAHNLGSFPFFEANTLGGATNLRGYRSTRFAGRTSFYQNVDLRVELFDFSSYVGFGQVGVLGFFDNGRVWTDGESSRRWHQGYGSGVWGYIFDAATLTSSVGFSPEEPTFTLQLGFQF